MKILYDNNGFVWKAVSKQTCVCGHTTQEGICTHVQDWCTTSADGLNVKSYSTYDRTIATLVDGYGVPMYKYADEVMQLITNFADYLVDTNVWAVYLKRLTDEVDEILLTKTNDEIKAIYEASPAYKQAVIYQELEFTAAQAVNQVVTNLSFESMIRILAEMEYIRVVEERSPTADELAGYKNVLTLLHDHSIGMGMPISITSWYQTYLHYMLDNSDALRTATIGRRFYITGQY